MRSHRHWNFNIDQYIEPMIPPPPWQHLPCPISWFLEYRKQAPAATGNLMPTFWAFIGVFSAIVVLEAVVTRVLLFESHGTPLIVGSFGAAAVLEFYAIESPFSQPRNLIIGQLISAVTGVSVARLFLLSERFNDIKWIAGATALLAVVDSDLLDLGWLLIPVVLLSCALMLVVALALNNVERQFLVYWWSPEDKVHKGPLIVRTAEVKGKVAGAGVDAGAAAEQAKRRLSNQDREAAPGTNGDEATDVDVDAVHVDVAGGDGAAVPAAKESVIVYLQVDEVIIRPGQVIVPERMYITQEEELLLESMCYRL